MTAESPVGTTAAVTLSSDGTGPYCTATLSAKRTRVVTTALSTLFGFAATAAASITGNVGGATPAGCSWQAASSSAAATTGRPRTVTLNAATPDRMMGRGRPGTRRCRRP